MISKLKYIIPVAAMVTLGLSSCKKDYLNINEDPNNPIDAPVSLILTGAQRSLGDALAMGGGENGGLSQILEVYVHRITTREEADQYGATGNEFFLGLAWPKLYSSTPPSGESEPLSGVLQNLEEIISAATAQDNIQYRGIAKILKAYTYSQLVDAFADVPFSEANKLADSVAPIVYPKFDKGEDIYPQLITMLDEGIADLTADATNLLTPGADDVIYNGNTDNWTKAANTIKLKLYTQMRLIPELQAEVTAAVTELLANPEDLINSNEESFMLPYGTLGATDDRNPAFQEYFSTQRSNHISPWFYETLKGRHTNVMFNNPDPRIPYYWYNQLRAKSTDPSIDYPGEAPDNQTEYRDDAFATIYFGSVGPDRDRNNQNTLTTLGIYPAGGRFDNGGGGNLGTWEEALKDYIDDPSDDTYPADGDGVSGSFGTGAAPYRFLTYADRLYLEAELINTGIVAGNAATVFEAAVRASFEQVDQVANMAGAVSQDLPKIMDKFKTEVETYITKVMTEYNNGDNNKKLELIMTQKWIQSFGNAVDAYTDYRRTGYPVMWDPSNNAMAPGGNAQPPANGDPFQPAQKVVPVLISRDYPQSLPWPTTELETNINAPASQKDPETYKVFWKP